MSDDALVILIAPDDAPPHWLRVADGGVAARGIGVDWPRGAVAGVVRALLVAPAAAMTLHRAALPDLAPRQASVAARMMALENSLGSPELLHVATGSRDADGALDVAVVANADMVRWLAWAADHGVDAGAIVPAALLLPRPVEGFARGVVGDEEVVRDASSAFGLDPALAPLMLGDAAVEPVAPAAVDAAILAALAMPPLDLRQGAFARRRRREIDRGIVRRAAVLAGLSLVASLVIALVQIAKLDADTARLDADALASARRVLPAVTSLGQAEAALDARAASLGVGGRGFGASSARLFAALDQSPAAVLTAFEATADGGIRTTVAAPQPGDIDVVVGALRASGANVEATPPQASDGRQSSALTVTAP